MKDHVPNWEELVKGVEYARRQAEERAGEIGVDFPSSITSWVALARAAGIDWDTLRRMKGAEILTMVEHAKEVEKYRRQIAGEAEKVPTPKEPRVRMKNDVVFLDGNPYSLPDDECVDFMRQVIEKKGDPFPATHHDMRTDRITKRLPKEIRAIIRTKAKPGTFIHHSYF